MKSAKQEYILSSVKNALLILQSFSETNPEKKTSELANELGIGKSTISRLLATLASEGFVKKDTETNRYLLGFSILNLSNIIKSNLNVHKESIPELNSLVKKINETANLVIFDEKEVICLHKIECSHPVRITMNFGSENTLHCTSTGKVILANMPFSFIDEMLHTNLIKYTTHTITEREILQKELSQIRQQGYALSNEEYLEGVCSLAAPIYNYTNEIIGAINVDGPVQRINGDTIQRIAQEVKDSASKISSKLGYIKQSKHYIKIR